MRISDWSSDVCSSDLTRSSAIRSSRKREDWRSLHEGRNAFFGRASGRLAIPIRSVSRSNYDASGSASASPFAWGGRSEEHTSELQSLMRISYAAFCLNKHQLIIHNKIRRAHG